MGQDEIMDRLERKSEPINPRLWYVNPENVREALQEAYNKGVMGEQDFSLDINNVVISGQGNTVGKIDNSEIL